VGVPAHRLVLGKHSGRNALRSRLANLGIALADEELGRCYRLVMALADVKKEINDADIQRLAQEAREGRDVTAAPVATGAAPRRTA
jgi:2-isopropylmalate synthase